MIVCVLYSIDLLLFDTYIPLICLSMEMIHTRSCFYRRKYFILLDSLVIIDMRLYFFAEFDEIMLLQSSIKQLSF